MAKKVLVFVSALVLCHVLGGWTMWVPTIGEGEYGFLRPYGTFSSSSNLQVSYQTLSDICASINNEISVGAYNKMEPFYSYPNDKFEASIVSHGSYTPTRYIIVVRNVTTSTGSVSFCSEDSHFIYACRDVDNEFTLKPLYTLVNSIKSTLSSISGNLVNVIGYVDNIEGYIDGIEGYIDGIEGLLSSQLSTLSDIKTLIDNRISLYTESSGEQWRLSTMSWYTMRGVNDIKSIASSILNDFPNDLYCGYSTNSGENYPTVSIPWSSAEFLVSFINSEFSGKTVTYVNASGVFYTYNFLRASLSSSGYISVVVSNSSGTQYDLWLCSKDHVMYVASDSVSRSELLLNSIIDKLSSIDIYFNSEVNKEYNLNITAKINALATATANIDVKLGSILDSLNLNFGSLLDDINLGFDAVGVGLADILDVLDDSAALPTTDLVPYVDELETYVQDSNLALDQVNTGLNVINGAVQRIAEWLDSQDVLDNQYISDLVSTWGDNLVYSIMNSNNIISLFHSAFGDVPSYLEWGRARQFFDSFYSGGV